MLRADVIGAELTIEAAAQRRQPEPRGTLVTCTLKPDRPHGPSEKQLRRACEGVDCRRSSGQARGAIRQKLNLSDGADLARYARCGSRRVLVALDLRQAEVSLEVEECQVETIDRHCKQKR